MGLLDSLQGMGTSFSNYMGNLDDQTGGLLTRLGKPQGQGNLIGAASLLGGEGMAKSFELRNKVMQNALVNQQYKKQKEGIAQLEKQFANNPKMLALLRSNPQGFMNAYTTSAFTPTTDASTSLMKNIRFLKEQFPDKSIAELIAMTKQPANVVNVNSSGDLNNTEFFKNLQKQGEEFLESYGNVATNINSLEGALETLETDANITGLGQGLTNLIGGDSALKLLFPETANIKAKIESVVQESLRVVLGPQFTATEGENILARAFDPAVSPQENAKRLRVILNKIKLGFESKKAYFDAFSQGKTPPPLPTLESMGLSEGSSSTTKAISNNMKVMLRKNRPNNINATDWETMINNLSLEELEPLLGQ